MQEGVDGVEQLDKVIITKDDKQELLDGLSWHGIHSELLFPDLDGLSGWMNWQLETKSFWHFDGKIEQE